MLKQGKGSDWDKVNGSAAALIITLKGIEWKLADERTVQTDEERTLDLLLDPPTATVNAVRAGSRRWRFRNIMEQVPSIKPIRPEVQGTRGDEYTTLDFASALRGLTKGRTKVVEECSERNSTCRAYLISAMS